ncbi:class I SAM-dependent methyltransferase [Shouchella sp. JSM 1781072]|uniref:class I SAM-dependent methyltransferase n=1 Tax=Bacillaceae TaxID=186817 RepID=UPI0020D01AB6|nr:class I SAM-dependent methyltransferase [Alkalihalobacillus sp. LMS6]UTR08107.1 class I SAM-dependent methyltransferase [Alkalihalobacillus sp. LMS6]
MEKYTDMLATFGIGSAHPGGFKKSTEIIMDMELDEHSIVLDCGCGTGQTAAYIKQLYDCQVTALEPHPLMYKKAQQRFESQFLSVDLRKAFIEAIPLDDSTTDYALSESVLSFASIQEGLSELHRVLKQSGSIYLNEFVCFSPLSMNEQETLKAEYGFSQLLHAKEWQQELANAGFRQIVVMETFTAATLQQDETDKGNDMQPSSTIAPSYYEKMHQHQTLMAHYKDKIGHILIKAIK